MGKYIPFFFLTYFICPSVQAIEGETEAIAKKTKPSIVVIKSKGRSDGKEALGTGFFISKDGLLATNYHVIGEGKKITLETADGKEIDISSVYAFDRENDLAILKAINPSGSFLQISDSTTFQDGTSVVAVGNPQGLKHSVVSGVISGKREIDGREMLQVAIPIEPGNSGGPIVNLEGKVLGILTIKSRFQKSPPLNFRLKLKSGLNSRMKVAQQVWFLIQMAKINILDSTLPTVKYDSQNLMDRMFIHGRF
ncbi:MAG: serine protease [Planctomycetes bacterium]|nr:serine protease [Planctomycetota bacterium]